MAGKLHNALVETVRLESVADDQAAETTSDTVNSTGVDLSADEGYDSVMFITKTGTLSASATPDVKLQQSSDDGSSDAYSDIAGSKLSLADTDDDVLVVHDIRRPREKFVRVQVDRDGNGAEIDSITAVLYDSRREVTQPSDVTSKVILRTPVEGTA